MKKKNVLSIWKVEDQISVSGYRFELRLDNEIIEKSFIPGDLVVLAIYLYFYKDFELTDKLHSIRYEFSRVVNDFEDFEIKNGIVF